MAQCTAKSKRSGERCKRYAVKGRTTCPMHGGKTLRGAEHPNFKHGKYSNDLPAHLGETYRQALANRDIIGLHDEIALIDTQLLTNLQRLQETGMSEGGWHQVRQAFHSLREHTNAGDAAATIRDFARLAQLIDGVESNHLAWRHINTLIENRRRLVETERRRLADEDKAIAIEKVMMLMAAVADIVRRHVSSPDTRKVISNEIRSLIESSE